MRARIKGGRPTRVRHVAGVPNATELEYARLYLEPRRLLGEIVRYEYEPDTLWLSERLPKRRRCTFTPDYKVWLPNGWHEYHECKGFFEPDAIIKTKWATEKFPNVRFVVAMRQRKGRWKVEIWGGWDAPT